MKLLKLLRYLSFVSLAYCVLVIIAMMGFVVVAALFGEEP